MEVLAGLIGRYERHHQVQGGRGGRPASRPGRAHAQALNVKLELSGLGDDVATFGTSSTSAPLRTLPSGHVAISMVDFASSGWAPPLIAPAAGPVPAANGSAEPDRSDRAYMISLACKSSGSGSRGSEPVKQVSFCQVQEIGPTGIPDVSCRERGASDSLADGRTGHLPVICVGLASDRKTDTSATSCGLSDASECDASLLTRSSLARLGRGSARAGATPRTRPSARPVFRLWTSRGMRDTLSRAMRSGPDSPDLPPEPSTPLEVIWASWRRRRVARNVRLVSDAAFFSRLLSELLVLAGHRKGATKASLGITRPSAKSSGSVRTEELDEAVWVWGQQLPIPAARSKRPTPTLPTSTPEECIHPPASLKLGGNRYMHYVKCNSCHGRWERIAPTMHNGFGTLPEQAKRMRVARRETTRVFPPKCTTCADQTLVLRSNRTGRQIFWGCPVYPRCRETRPCTVNGASLILDSGVHDRRGRKVGPAASHGSGTGGLDDERLRERLGLGGAVMRTGGRGSKASEFDFQNEELEESRLYFLSAGGEMRHCREAQLGSVIYQEGSRPRFSSDADGIFGGTVATFQAEPDGSITEERSPLADKRRLESRICEVFHVSSAASSAGSFNEDPDVNLPKQVRKAIERSLTHISEVCSVPRVTPLCAKYGLQAGSAMDFRTGFGFSKRSHQKRAWGILEEESPHRAPCGHH